MKGWPGEPEMAYGEVMAEGEARQASGRPVTDVIFDFGNVLVDWDPAAVMLPRYSAELTERFLDNDVSGFYDASDEMDVGGTIEQAVGHIRASHGEPWATMFRYYCENFEDSLLGVIRGMRVLLADLRAAGVGVWGLSNWAEELFGVAERQYPILSSLDGRVVSGEVRLRKPHADIFRFALDRFGVDAGTALFVDDKSMNIVGANAVGMRGVRFNDAVRLRELLRGLGVAIPDVRH
ncbi:HAD family phosphatase [Bifidobacterium sp. ESL0763]|uniref:HAD family hydrolase n=1 Tax=Bifidobacterium sp. ESL0763 TaxID=2983227 RepID=UPI0023F95851|nr:HAD family phosphatase [Bifidobacterium sp. ESL0763]MDF7663645.1 HAD family phosphatase [Bifidobacterium sp. ESL0763]